MDRTPDGITLTGQFPGLVGKLAALHAGYYAEHWGFDASFESGVTTELGQLLARLDPRKDLLLAAMDRDRLVGGVAIDGGGGHSYGARLRFFVVDPAYQGRGLGDRLLQSALGFAREAGHKLIYLWTFQGLDAARRLYERWGFSLTATHTVSQWGSNQLEEQMFELWLD